MRRPGAFLLALIIGLVGMGEAFAESGGQVFYRGGWSCLSRSRAGETFTGVTKGCGYDVGAGLDIPLTKDPWQNTLLGEIMLDYASFSNKNVSELAGVVAPKYRFELGKFRPWVIPVGLTFLVNTPPSNNVTYLDFGAHFAAGVEYRLIDLVSLGIDYRYTLGAGRSHTETDYGTFGGYVGINF